MTSLLFLFLVTLLLVVPGIIAPVYTKIFIDDVLLQNARSWMRPLIIGMVATALISALFTWMQQKTLNRFQQKLSITLSSRFFWHLLRLPTDFFAQRFIGDLNSRVQACDQMAALVSGQLATNAVQLIMVFFYGVVMFFYDVWMTLAVISLNMINMIMLKVLTKVRDESLQRVEKENRKLAGVSINGVSIIETLKSNGPRERVLLEVGRLPRQHGGGAAALRHLDQRAQPVSDDDHRADDDLRIRARQLAHHRGRPDHRQRHRLQHAGGQFQLAVRGSAGGQPEPAGGARLDHDDQRRHALRAR